MLIPAQKVLNPQHFLLASLLFLYCIGVYSQIIGLIIFPSIAFLHFVKTRFQISLSSLFLMAFTASYVAISYWHGIISLSTGVVYMIMPISLYFVGEYVITKGFHDRLAFYYTYLVLFSFFLFGISSVGWTAYYGGFSDAFMNRRVLYMPGSDVWVNATNMGAYFTMGISLIGYIVTYEKGNGPKAGKLISLVIFVVAVASMLLIGNRTGLVVTIGSFLAAYYVAMFRMPHSIRNKIKTNFVIILVIFTVIYIVQSNFLGLGELLLESTLIQRISTGYFFEDPRTDAWHVAIRGLYEYPLGGRQANIALNYVHNLWLDVGYVAGIIPFALLIAFSWLAVRNLLSLISSKTTPIGLKTFFTGVYVALLINFSFEPVLEGYFVHFAMFCFIAGLTRKYVRLSNWDAE
ncbi:MAG: hypothetical protein DDT40_00409 [candidate division WS2 bacterium]|nr:hypothetical protein [Candidatus Psychracetigena formicireducens]